MNYVYLNVHGIDDFSEKYVFFILICIKIVIYSEKFVLNKHGSKEVHKRSSPEKVLTYKFRLYPMCRAFARGNFLRFSDPPKFEHL